MLFHGWLIGCYLLDGDTDDLWSNDYRRIKMLFGMRWVSGPRLLELMEVPSSYTDTRTHTHYLLPKCFYISTNTITMIWQAASDAEEPINAGHLQTELINYNV